jgi:hypothetical protein
MPLTPKRSASLVTRANMRFVATKTPEQQSGLVLHRTQSGTSIDRLIESLPVRSLDRYDPPS